MFFLTNWKKRKHTFNPGMDIMSGGHIQHLFNHFRRTNHTSFHPRSLANQSNRMEWCCWGLWCSYYHQLSLHCQQLHIITLEDIKEEIWEEGRRKRGREGDQYHEVGIKQHVVLIRSDNDEVEICSGIEEDICNYYYYYNYYYECN